jgi:tetratricopeptide (TPR) repeat protein
MKGNQLLTEGKTDAAIESFKHAVESSPKFSWAHGKLASLYYQQGDVEKAAAQYRAGITANPDDNIIKADYANFLVNEKRLDEAEEILKVLQEMNPMDVGAHVNNLLAGIYMARGDFASAIPCYRKGLEIEPDNRMMRALLAFAFQRADQLPEAMAIYTQLEKEDPEDFNVLFNMAMIHGIKGEYADAAAYFERTLKVKPAPVVYYNYAFFLSKAGKYGEAIEKMKKFLEMYPHNDGNRQNALQFIERMKALK